MQYEIRIDAVLDERWSDQFRGFQVSTEPHGVTLIAGDVVDQAALLGLLSQVRDLGLYLVSVSRVRPDKASRS